jgi:hypothetical protein
MVQNQYVSSVNLSVHYCVAREFHSLLHTLISIQKFATVTQRKMCSITAKTGFLHKCNKHVYQSAAREFHSRLHTFIPTL